jgi:hypothetical protein
MREKLIEALERVRAREARERVKEMTDEQLDAMIAADLGLPLGIKFTDEQLQIIARSQETPVRR